MRQELFDASQTHFAWDGDWYTFEAGAGQAEAKRRRAARIKELRAQGYDCKAFSLGTQQLTKGGIGSGHPEITIFVKGYGINIFLGASLR